MTAPERGPLLTFLWKAHRLLYSLSRGRLGGRAVGLPVLELTTVGRRSGQVRRVLLNYLDDPEGFVVIASNAGDARNPSWWLNLQADPMATVRVARNRFQARAEEVSPEEYGGLFARFVQANPGYAEYASLTSRRIPIVRLRLRH